MTDDAIRASAKVALGMLLIGPAEKWLTDVARRQRFQPSMTPIQREMVRQETRALWMTIWRLGPIELDATDLKCTTSCG